MIWVPMIWVSMEPNMKQLSFLAVVIALAVPGDAARAETWCVRDAAGTMSPICAFSSAQDCIHAAILGPSGSICAQDSGPPAESADARPGKRHKARPQQQADRWNN
jgi:hypothetical protein